MKTVDDPSSSSSASSKPSDAGAGAAGSSQASIAAGASHTSTAEEGSDEGKSEYIGFYKRASLNFVHYISTLHHTVINYIKR